MKVKMKVKSLSRVRLLATPWTAAYQAPPSMGFSRQESIKRKEEKRISSHGRSGIAQLNDFCLVEFHFEVTKINLRYRINLT